jgi:hypothetical protein
MTGRYAEEWPDWRLAVLPAAFCLSRTHSLLFVEGLPLEPLRGRFVSLVDRWGYLTSVTDCDRHYRAGMICRARFPIAPHARTTNEPYVRLSFCVDPETPGGLEIARRWPQRWPEFLLSNPQRSKGHGRWRRFATDTAGCVELVRWALERADEDPTAAPVAVFPDPSPAPADRQPRAPKPVTPSGRPSHRRRPISLAGHYL